MPAYLCAHVAVIVIVIVVAVAAPVRVRREAFSPLLQLAFWTAAAGLFGVMIAMALAASWRASAPNDQDVGAWLEEQAAVWRQKTDKLNSGLLDQRLRIEGADKTTALVDVFLEGGRREKFDALQVIGRAYDPSFDLALRLAMRDSDPSVRVLASSVIAKLQTKAAKRLELLHETAVNRIDSADAWRELADAHADYATSGLVSAYQAREHINSAIAHTSRALTFAPRSEAIRFRLAELLIEGQHYRRTIEVLDFEWGYDSAAERAIELRELALREIAASASRVIPDVARYEAPADTVASPVERYGAVSPVRTP